jgi:alpha-glucuronidase
MGEKNWSQLWLRYKKIDRKYDYDLSSFGVIGFDVEEPIIKSVIREYTRGISSLLEIVESDVSIVNAAESGVCVRFIANSDVAAEGYIIRSSEYIEVQASDSKGLLYGMFHLLRLIAREQDLVGLNISKSPSSQLRMLNHWDNMDGSIERGYSGESFFFANHEIIVDERTRDYCRFISSIGINAVVINNVNVKDTATELISNRYYDKLSELSTLMSEYGIRLMLSLNFAAPMELGHMDTVDPLDVGVIKWWKDKIKEVYDNIPELGGFLVKADSEGRPGPFTYGRTQAEGANMLGEIIEPYGGIIIWRAFVYNCQQDWRDKKNDRACAGYNNFIKTDGDFRENCILQVKNGPMDFQIREPVSPLFGAMKKTNEMMEFQIAQEYTGQQIDICYLIPMYKEVLGFHTHCSDMNDTVADIVTGKTYGNKYSGVAAVVNTGNDYNWTGNDMAAANLYGYGRLIYDMDLSSEEIAREWIELTLTHDQKAENTICKMLLESREIYEQYTTPLGVGWMVTPHYHYGPSIDGYEYSRWGCYHRADHIGIGVDRTSNGTGYCNQYFAPLNEMYDDIDKCPEELLLFFHHVPYTHIMKDGRTLIQFLYDSHFEGAERARGLKSAFESIKDQLEADVYERVLERLDRQIANADEWRDQFNSHFYKITGIEDNKGRIIY